MIAVAAWAVLIVCIVAVLAVIARELPNATSGSPAVTWKYTPLVMVSAVLLAAVATWVAATTG